MTSEELFADVDLDALYMRQIRVLAADGGRPYPFLLLIHTGKITVGINLGDRFHEFDEEGCAMHDRNDQAQDEVFGIVKPVKEPSE
jgi:hypothetical protein